MVLTFLNKHRHIGLLVLRIGIGCMFLFHGAPKVFGGVEKWAQVGEAMESFGIGFMPAFWGFMAAISEFFGGVCLIFGILFRPACILMAITMLVAAVSDLSEGEGLREAAHAIELGIVFLSLILIGAGKYSLDERFQPQQEESN
ncbi:MAG: DoxX family protein [Candidatus Poribacteria bacterium]|nr:DoxX family protein [Candidatus Poribacteria bacterium]